ncbi:MAG TPA: MBL fold metallo-hydrolase [Elusimicrobiota bacterium]|nr:MBL fold metallo-hydrolase [Elusimicrobiota bacterium]
MIRLADNAYSWNKFNEEKGLNFNGTLIVGAGEVIVVDPPPHSGGDEAFLDQKLKQKPTLAVVTNKHHLRDVQWWLERYQIPLAMHETETNEYGFEVSRKLKDGDHIWAGCQIVHLPGKTEGEIAIHIDGDGGTLLVGDALIGDPMGALRFLPREKIRDQDLLEKSLQKLRALSFERLLAGDGEPILAGAKAAVLKFLDALPGAART